MSWLACCFCLGCLSFCWFTERRYRKQFTFQESILDRERDRRRAMLKSLDKCREENRELKAQLAAISNQNFPVSTDGTPSDA